MGLESSTYINDLNTANPLGTDTKTAGDDHLRLIKSTVKATFPGMAGAAWRVQGKAANYTVVANDNMSIVRCTAALTLALTAAATLGNQHMFIAYADGGAVTIDPNGAELINGAATLSVPDGTAVLVVCNATAFFALFMFETSDITSLVSAASETVAGKVELDTLAEAATGTDTSRAVTAKGLATAASRGLVLHNGKIVASVAGNALTIAIKTLADADPSASDPVTLIMPDETLATGSPDFVTLTAAASLVIPNTATMGATNATAFRLWIVGINSGAAFAEIGAVNCLSGTSIFALDEGGLYSPTAVSTGADSAHVIYTTSGQTSKPFRVLGYLEWATGLTAAGVWDAAPTIVRQMMAGVKLPGQEVQCQELTSGATDTSTTVIPDDNTIPQNTEGEEWGAGTVAITPRGAANLLDVAFEGFMGGNDQRATVALFVDTTADAIAAGGFFNRTTSSSVQAINVRKRVLSASTTARTYKMRHGPGTAATSAVNGGNGGGIYGGVCFSRLVAREIMA